MSLNKQGLINTVKYIVAPIAAISFIEWMVHSSMTKQSLEDIQAMQEKKRAKELFQTMDMLASPLVQIAIMLSYFACAAKSASLYLFNAWALVNYISNLTQLLLAVPRPFMQNENILCETCSLSYGLPNSKVVSMSFILLAVYLSIYHELDVVQPKMSIFCTTYILKMGFTTVMSIYLALLSASQIYLGVSTTDQAFFSLALGLVFAFGLHQTMRRTYLGLVDRLKKSNANQFSQKKIKSAIFRTVVQGLCFVVYAAIIEALVMETNTNENDLWTIIQKSNSVKQTCGELIGKGAALTSVSIGRCAVILIGTGATLGQLLEWQKFVKEGHVKGNQWDWYQTQGFGPAGIRVIICMALWVFVGGIYKFLHDMGPVYNNKVASFNVNAFFSLILGFSTFALLRAAFTKMELVHVSANPETMSWADFNQRKANESAVQSNNKYNSRNQGGAIIETMNSSADIEDSMELNEI